VKLLRAGRSRGATACFINFVARVSPPGLEPAVMAQVITVDLDPTDLGTGSYDNFDPSVMGLCV
jgi:hypothetical protein